MPPAGVPLQMASNREEFRALAPLVVATLNALNTFSDEAFRVHLSVSKRRQRSVQRICWAAVCQLVNACWPCLQDI
jgi:hypothetical protein